jgi:hypothetical protein
MKKSYAKPILIRREKLGSVTAVPVPISPELTIT